MKKTSRKKGKVNPVSMDEGKVNGKKKAKARMIQNVTKITLGKKAADKMKDKYKDKILEEENELDFKEEWEEEDELSEKKIEEKKLHTKLKKLQARYMYWYCWRNQPKGKMGRKGIFKDTRSIVFIVDITPTRPHQNRRPVGTVRPVWGQMMKYTCFVLLVLVTSVFRCT